eukprot:Nitzschia sp. Nitz4//scaffold51_size120721//27077//29260//NITZ4_003719-RA/size120721-processed-gene-0.113-mRNA-1//1//CDS//3329553838//5600//frame0
MLWFRIVGNLLLVLLLQATCTSARLLEDEEEEMPYPNVTKYLIWEANQFAERLVVWQAQYPDLIQVTTSQDKYGLPAAGGSEDCPFYPGEGCPNYIATIQDYLVHPVGSDSSNRLPEVLWSGCLHGDERVGPTSVMEAAQLLLESAACEGLPRTREERPDAHACRQALYKKGVYDVHRKWLARLATTRRIVIVPTANALGYFRKVRTEGTIDPNRDFPYDVTDPSMCMQTIAARTLNEVFRDHMFQLSLTFHAGMEVVGYEWGAPTWYNKDDPDHDYMSPDDIAQEFIGAAYSRYGGGWSKSKPYNYGTMNELVYYVNGGMEDWAYAGSWDPDRVVPCEPNTFDGYPAEKTTYGDSTLRAFNMLIETSNLKTPPKNQLGTTYEVMEERTPQNGHISRNIRLSLLAAELVEPYVSILSVNHAVLQDDMVPFLERNDRTCVRHKTVSVAKDATSVEVRFTVGGALSIDQVDVWIAPWKSIPTDQLDCISQPTGTEGFVQGTIESASTGAGRYSLSGSQPPVPKDLIHSTNGPVFQARLEIPEGLDVLDEIVVLASARVDQSWKESPDNVKPDMDPQSHIVNARTNPDWHHESAGKHVVGRLDWFSSPLTLVVGDYKEAVGLGNEELVTSVEMYTRLEDPRSGVMAGSSSSGGSHGLLVIMLVMIVVGAVWYYRRSSNTRQIDFAGLSSAQFGLEMGGMGGTHYQDEAEDDDDDDDDELDEEEVGDHVVT